MHRSMMHVNVKNSGKAFEFYKKAFDAKEVCRHANPDGTLAHAELDVCGQVMSFMELSDDDAVAGNTMSFGLHFGKGKEAVVRKIYDVLKEGAKIHDPLGSCEWSPLMTCLIDKFGVSWLIFV
ncbi:MAG: VOC family protein [Oscillospiraceae bacterium]|nr:VOC family protein [Oscillospiraceae bacterium]